MHLYYCHYEYEIQTKKEAYRERAYVEFKTNLFPTKQEIESKILFEWKQKGIANRVITEIYQPEKIY